MFAVTVDLEAFDRGSAAAAAFVEEVVVPDLVAAIALQILRGAILRSRVDTGRYRMGHMLEIDRFPDEAPPPQPKGQTQPAPAVDAVASEVSRLRKNQWIGFANNVAYAAVREWGSETQTADLTVTRAIEAAVRWANGLGEVEGGVAGGVA